MKRPEFITNRVWSSIPPWIVAGASLVLFPLFGFVTFTNIQAQKENSYRLLLEKGAALIRAFEAGTRTGIAGEGFKLQRLLMETAQQPDIQYLFVIGENGTILAHSQPEQIGRKIRKALLPQNQVIAEGQSLKQTRSTIYWRILQGKGENQTFEIYRPFLPAPTKERILRQRMQLHASLAPELCDPSRFHHSNLVIFIGLDMQTMETARMTEMWHSLLMGGTLLVVGLAGIVFVFLFQSFQFTHNALTRVRAFSNHVVENMPIGLVALDDRLLLHSLNPLAARLLKLDAIPPAGTPARAFLPAPLFDFVVDADPTSPILREEGLYKEIACATGNQATRLEASLSRLAPTEVDETGGMMLLIRDLSEIDALRKEIARNQRLVTVGKLAAGVAHEIRNPLSSIKGFATLFRHRHGDNEEERNIADIMIQEVDRLNRVVSQLLDFSKPVVVSCRPTRITELVESSLHLVKAAAEESGIQVEQRIPEDLALRLDTDRIHQVLLNIFLNAIDAMKSGGWLIVEGKITDKEVLIQVTDTGTGIAESELPHVFDPYFTTKQSGTGLGLAIAHNIMEAHHGKILVTSIPEQGTVFTLCFSRKEIVDASFHPDCG